MRALTIGTAAREAGVGVETIRFYERQNLVERPQKPVGAGVRRYPSETVARIRFIREAQQLGFSLREIRELLALRADPAADCSKVRQQALAKLHEVHDKIERLRQIGAALETLIAACPAQGGLQACSIIDALELRSRRAVELRETSTRKDGMKRRTRT
jgi:MerR family transcriptional regulator, copper efflux regulator